MRSRCSRSGSTRSKGFVATLDGSIPVPELLELIGRVSDETDENDEKIFEKDLVDLVGLGTASIADLELTADSDGPVFGFLGTLTDVAPDLFEDLRVQLLLGVEGVGLAPTTIVALLVDSDGCESDEWIRLEQVIPLPGDGLSIDVDLPAVRFLQIAPEGAEFTTAKLGDKAREFLKGFVDDGEDGEGDEGGGSGEGDTDTDTGASIQSFSLASTGRIPVRDARVPARPTPRRGSPSGSCS